MHELALSRAGSSEDGFLVVRCAAAEILTGIRTMPLDWDAAHKLHVLLGRRQRHHCRHVQPVYGTIYSMNTWDTCEVPTYK